MINCDHLFVIINLNFDWDWGKKDIKQ